MSLLDDIQALHTSATAALGEIKIAETLEAWRIKYLGTKGLLKATMQRLREAPREEKPALGQAANQLKIALTKAFEEHKGKLGGGSTDAKKTSKTSAKLDITLPGNQPKIGHNHIISQTVSEICEICARMGFEVAYGPEVEDELHNFVALNIPDHHPARDPLDNFYLYPGAMLRSQTSTVQIRVMENTQPPVRIIAPGRVYRPDTVDATHSFMFHQVEGLYVDEGVTMADLKTTLDQFCKAYFGHEVQTRFRPSFFPFTEPSAEIDVLFHYDDGSTRWIELGGCGMVDPNVLQSVNYDPEKYTGFAFGLGIERMVMRRHNIPDIRYLYESDVRFLHQF
jgi:phenylalanyl-tRNA synthetase alpha chain